SLQLFCEGLRNPGEKLRRVWPRERDVLSEVVGECVDEIPVPALVELRLIGDLRLFESVPANISLDTELEVEGCKSSVSGTSALGLRTHLADSLPFLPVWRQS